MGRPFRADNEWRDCDPQGIALGWYGSALQAFGHAVGCAWRQESSIRLAAALAIVFCLHANLALAQRDVKDIPPPDPELERQVLQVADGFEVNLWAADPLFAKPIQMNFDARGRLWVATSEVYPQILPGQRADDKILILEDTTGSGRADTTTVFADGLLIPTGVLPGDGGAYVANSTELLFLHENREAGHADSRRIVLSGFGTEDTHHIIHAFDWGPDGMLYFNQSVYIHSHVETPYGVRRLNAGGIWQFRPETMELEVFARGWWNCWGHKWDYWGQSFATDGAGGDGINYVVPGAYYAAAADAQRILPGLNPGSPKDCSLEVLSGRHLPADWRGNLITNDFRAHRVCRYVLTENGSGFSAKEMPELIKTNHPAFRPIDVKMGPDGAIYIADWYNPIIQHGEVDFRDPRRDHTHGRIWRVTAKGRPLVERPKLVGASDEALLDALKAPEGFERQQAKQLLKERGNKDMLPALAAWVKRLDPADPDVEHHRLEALWTYQSLRHVEPDLLRSLLKSREPHARAAATRALADCQAQIPDALDLLANLVVDEHPRVRLEAVRALSRIQSPAAAEVAMRALDQQMDQFLDYALWLTARDLQESWLPALRSGTASFDGSPKHLAFALQAVGSKDVVGPLMALLREGKLPNDRTESVLLLIATLGGPRELGAMFDLALAESTAPARRNALLSGLAKTAEQRGVVPAGNLGRLGKFLVSTDADLQSLAARTAGLWKVESLRPRLTELAQAAATTPKRRQAAIDGLALLGGAPSRKVLDQLTAGERPFETRAQSAVALATMDLTAGARRAADVLSAAPAGADPTALVAAFLERKQGAAALASAISKVRLPADIAKLGIRTVRASASDQPALVAVLTTAGGLAASGPRMPIGAALAQMIADVKSQGDPARGEVIFRRQEQSCQKCHAIGGVGGQVGPDLVSIGASAQIDYLIESILEPSAKIKEGYHSAVATTTRGKIVTGIKLRQTDKDLILRDAEDHEIAVPLNAIDTQEISQTSLMPIGLADNLTRAELIDLVRFLSELGKIGPYSLSKAPIARRWQALVPTANSAAALQSSLGTEQIIGDNLPLPLGEGRGEGTWAPIYSQVSGDLPLDGLPHYVGANRPPLAAIRCQLETLDSEPVSLKLNDTLGLRIWIDKNPVKPDVKMEVALDRGIHLILIEIDLHQRRDPLRLELAERPELRTRAQFFAGK